MRLHARIAAIVCVGASLLTACGADNSAEKDTVAPATATDASANDADTAATNAGTPAGGDCVTAVGTSFSQPRSYTYATDGYGKGSLMFDVEDLAVNETRDLMVIGEGGMTVPFDPTQVSPGVGRGARPIAAVADGLIWDFQRLDETALNGDTLTNHLALVTHEGQVAWTRPIGDLDIIAPTAEGDILIHEMGTVGIADEIYDSTVQVIDGETGEDAGTALVKDVKAQSLLGAGRNEITAKFGDYPSSSPVYLNADANDVATEIVQDGQTIGRLAPLAGYARPMVAVNDSWIVEGATTTKDGEGNRDLIITSRADGTGQRLDDVAANGIGLCEDYLYIGVGSAIRIFDLANGLAEVGEPITVDGLCATTVFPLAAMPSVLAISCDSENGNMVQFLINTPDAIQD